MVMNTYIPQICVWELTLRCNMRCIHCGSVAGRSRKNELTVEECLPVADQLIELGCRQTTFIGGEVFLYKGWEQIARRLSDGGILVNIVTNAFLMNHTQLEQVKRANMSNVGISIDGMEESHNKIRQNSQSFQRALKAIQKLRQNNIHVGAVTTLLDFNFYELDRIYDLLLENGVTVWQLQLATAMGNMKDKKEYLLNPDKLSQVTAFIRRKREECGIKIYAGDNIGYYDENEPYIRTDPGVIGTWQGCQAGLRVVGIDSVGNIKGCESLCSDYFIEGNVRKEPLSQIWHKEGNFAYNRRFDVAQLTGGCAGCDKAEVCRGGCRGSCFFSTDMLYDNPYCNYAGRSNGHKKKKATAGRKSPHS